MRFEGVTFIESALSGLTKEQFIKMHINAFWLDRTRKEREKMLSDVYDLIFSDQA